MKSYIYIVVVLFASAIEIHAQKAMNLGLSVRWANMNVGASAPEEYGDYFAWGETDTKRYYGYYSSYKHFDNKVYRKYNYYHFSGSTVDSLVTLRKEDDAATKIMGRKWRMPTADEVYELFAKCTFTEAKVNGARGFLVANKSGIGDTIFLPFTGFKYYGNYRSYPATIGYYWTSTLIGKEVYNKALMDSIDSEHKLVRNAMCLMLDKRKVPVVSFWERRNGCTIRAVTDEKK